MGEVFPQSDDKPFTDVLNGKLAIYGNLFMFNDLY